MDIFQFWDVYRTVRKKDFVFLARVRVTLPKCRLLYEVDYDPCHLFRSSAALFSW